MNPKLSLNGQRLLGRRDFLHSGITTLGGISLIDLLAKQSAFANTESQPWRPSIAPARPFAPRQPHHHAKAEQMLIISCDGAPLPPDYEPPLPPDEASSPTTDAKLALDAAALQKSIMKAGRIRVGYRGRLLQPKDQPLINGIHSTDVSYIADRRGHDAFRLLRRGRRPGRQHVHHVKQNIDGQVREVRVAAPVQHQQRAHHLAERRRERRVHLALRLPEQVA